MNSGRLCTFLLTALILFALSGCKMGQVMPGGQNTGTAVSLRSVVSAEEYSALAGEYQKSQYPEAAERIGKWLDGNQAFCGYMGDWTDNNSDLTGQCGSGYGWQFADADNFAALQAAAASGDYEAIKTLLLEMSQAGNTEGTLGIERILSRMFAENTNTGTGGRRRGRGMSQW